jgi:hypothetical protein
MGSGWGSGWDSIRGYVYVDDDMVETYKTTTFDVDYTMQWTSSGIVDRIKPISEYVYHKYFDF